MANHMPTAWEMCRRVVVGCVVACVDPYGPVGAGVAVVAWVAILKRRFVTSMWAVEMAEFCISVEVGSVTVRAMRALDDVGLPASWVICAALFVLL